MQEKTPVFTPGSSPAAAATISAGSDRFARSAHSGIDAASQAAHPSIDRLASGAHKAVDSADDAAINAAKALGRAGTKSKELFAAGTGYMREHPLLALGLAVTAGFVLSRVLASRQHQET